MCPAAIASGRRRASNYPELWDQLPPEQAAKRLGGDRFKALNLTPYAYAHPPALFRTILTEKPYPVKALIVVGNNTATCYPEYVRPSSRRCSKLDLLVVQDIFMTPTAEYADVVLPAAGNLERDEPRLHMHIKGPGGHVHGYVVAQDRARSPSGARTGSSSSVSARRSATRSISPRSRSSPTKPCSRWG